VYTRDQIEKKLIEDFTYWYHRIDLGNGIITPGFHYEPLWDNIRTVRQNINYKGKTVLDIASFDGLWAFEAEKLGANIVVATDCLYRTFRNFMFCKEILRSNCIPYYNVSPYNLYERLDTFFQENYDSEQPYDRMFDIVQHLGLFYHLRDPFLSLSQARSCIKSGGILLIETNVVLNNDESFMLYNGIPDTYRASKNYSVWWIPTVKCLKEMLLASLFEPIDNTISIVDFDTPLFDKDKKIAKKPDAIDKEYKIARLCMIARASDPKKTDPEFLRELNRTFRNPGLDITHV